MSLLVCFLRNVRYLRKSNPSFPDTYILFYLEQRCFFVVPEKMLSLAEHLFGMKERITQSGGKICSL